MRQVLRSEIRGIFGFILPFAAACLALGLAGCGGGGGGTTSATLSSIAITPASATVAKGATASLTATGTYSNGTTADITTQVTWISATPTTASVGANTGVVTGASAGSTTVTAALSGVTSPAATITVAYDYYVDASTGMNPLSCTAYPMPPYYSFYPSWGDGTAAHPFKTITCALAAAKAKVTGTGAAVSVKILPGLYNVASGETFPLTLSTKVSLVGDTANKGAPAGGTATEINGSALSPAITGGVGINTTRNCAIFIPPAAANAAISGFKITGGTLSVTSSLVADAATSLTIADNRFSMATVGIIGMELFNGTTASIARNIAATTFAVDAEDVTTGITLRGNTMNGTYGVVTGLWGTPGVGAYTGNAIIDLGTAVDPGNNIIQSVTTGFYVLASAGTTTYNAVGNTWNVTQSADANGHYPGTLVVGPAAGANFNIPAGVSIQF